MSSIYLTRWTSAEKGQKQVSDAIPGPRSHSISINGFLKKHGYLYSWFLDISLRLSMHVMWISTFKSNQGNPCKDILRGIYVKNQYPWIDIHALWICLQLSMLLLISVWKSIDFYGCPCMDLLRILDPGITSSGCTTKTGPEAGQYFHVRPPIGFIWMGYKTQQEYENHRKTQARSNPFCPILGPCLTLGAVASGNFL